MGSILMNCMNTVCMRIDVVEDVEDVEEKKRNVNNAENVEEKKRYVNNAENVEGVEENKRGVDEQKHMQKTLQQCTLENTKPVMYKFNKAKVIKVYDGDTITIAALHDGGFCRFSVRFFGVDCDEIRGGTDETKHNAQLAKRYISALVLNKIVDIEVMNDEHEKFGRLLAKVSIDGVSISNKLLEIGLARPYDGGKKDDTPLQPSPHLELEIARLLGKEIND